MITILIALDNEIKILYHGCQLFNALTHYKQNKTSIAKFSNKEIENRWNKILNNL